MMGQDLHPSDISRWDWVRAGIKCLSNHGARYEEGAGTAKAIILTLMVNGFRPPDWMAVSSSCVVIGWEYYHLGDLLIDVAARPMSFALRLRDGRIFDGPEAIYSAIERKQKGEVE